MASRRVDARNSEHSRDTREEMTVDWIQRLHGRWFRLSSEQFDALHYLGMSVFLPFIVLSALSR